MLWDSEHPAWLGLWVRTVVLPRRAEQYQGIGRWRGQAAGTSIAPLWALAGGTYMAEGASSAEQPQVLKSARFILAVGTLGNSKGKFHF